MLSEGILSALSPPKKRKVLTSSTDSYPPKSSAQHSIVFAEWRRAKKQQAALWNVSQDQNVLVMPNNVLLNNTFSKLPSLSHDIVRFSEGVLAPTLQHYTHGQQ